MNYSHVKEYFKTDISDDYFCINSDGTSTNKEQTLIYVTRLKTVEMATVKILDRKIRTYGDVRDNNGRAKAFFKETLVAEFLLQQSLSDKTANG